MEQAPKGKTQTSEASYSVENRKFVVHRYFGCDQTIKDLLISEISQGVLQNSCLNSATESGMLEE